MLSVLAVSGSLSSVFTRMITLSSHGWVGGHEGMILYARGGIRVMWKRKPEVNWCTLGLRPARPFPVKVSEVRTLKISESHCHTWDLSQGTARSTMRITSRYMRATNSVQRRCLRMNMIYTRKR